MEDIVSNEISNILKALVKEARSTPKGCEVLNRVVNRLTPRQQKVMRLLTGYGDEYPGTLEEVCSLFNLTRERVRRIEEKALKKLKHPSRSRKLREFLALGK